MLRTYFQIWVTTEKWTKWQENDSNCVTCDHWRPRSGYIPVFSAGFHSHYVRVKLQNEHVHAKYTALLQQAAKIETSLCIQDLCYSLSNHAVCFFVFFFFVFFLFVLFCQCFLYIMQIVDRSLFKYIENFTSKNWNFSDKKKNSDIFHISAQNIDCGYSLEPPRRGGSNEYPQSMFLSRNIKDNV